MNPGMNINPKAAEEREMAQRNANLQFAGQLMLSMMQGSVAMVGGVTPEQVFQFAMGVAEQMSLYFGRPFDEPTRLVS